MLKKDAVDLYINLNKLGKLTGVKFAYAVSRNISLLKPEIESLDKATEMSEEYKGLEEKRMELVKKFAKKDDKGEPVVVENNYQMEDQKIFDIAFETLKSENKTVWDARLKQIQEYQELLKTKSEVVLYKVGLNEVPQNITVDQMYSIREIIDEATPTPYPPK